MSPAENAPATQAPPQPGGPAVRVDGVSFSYPGVAEPALDGVSLTVDARERLGVLGPNGGGKSTLIRIVLGLIEPDRGTARVFGCAPKEARRQGWIGYVPQRSAAERAFPLSVRQVVRMPVAMRAGLFGRLDAKARRDADRAIELVGLQAVAERPIAALSGGQFQRVLIARAVAARPRLLLLDEPTVGIDVEGQRRFADMLGSLRDELGLAIVTVSHDVRTVALSSDRVACLRRTLHYHAAPDGLTPEVLAELFSHDVAALFGDPVHVHAHGDPHCVADGHTPCGDSHEVHEAGGAARAHD